MPTPIEGHLLRVYVNESDRWEGRPLYEAVVRAARDAGLAGATVLRGVEGFGARNRIHSVRVLHLSEDVPIVVELLDRPERITQFIPTLDKMIAGGVVTLEKVNMLVYLREETAEQADEDEIPLDTGEASAAEGSQPVFAESVDGTHQVIEAAKESATRSRRAYFDSVDVLLALLCESNGIATNALAKLGLDCRTVTRSLRDMVNRDVPTAAFQKALEKKSVSAAKWLEHKDLGSEHLLLGLCQIRPSAATDVLMRLGAQPRDICQETLNILGHEDDWQRWLADHPDM
jgi:PII-like signaling protein